MKKKIVITAANGFLGEALVKHFVKKYEVVALVRHECEFVKGVHYVKWDGKSLGPWQKTFEGAEAIINLAGKSVNCRYNETNKEAILRSRIESTEVIGQAIDLCANPPKVWMNSASATIYQHSEFQPMTESDGVLGDGFSVDVCKAWEKCFFDYSIRGVRQVALRTAIVLDSKRGAFPVLKKVVRMGFGGKQGSGGQQFSWIHIQDFCRAVEFIMKDHQIEGAINLSAPFPVTNHYFQQNLRKRLGMRIALNLPEWMLRFGAFFMGTETELVLKSRYVVPDRLLRKRFRFKFARIELALRQLVA